MKVNEEFEIVIEMRSNKRAWRKLSNFVGTRFQAIPVKILIGRAVGGVRVRRGKAWAKRGEEEKVGGKCAGPTRSVKSRGAGAGRTWPLAYYLLSPILHARKFPRQRVR